MKRVTQVILTDDEEYDAAGRISEQVRIMLKNLKLDTYNKTYVVRVSVEEVDERLTEEDDDA